MRICILETELAPEAHVAAFGTFPDMIRDWLGPALPEASFSVVSMVRRATSRGKKPGLSIKPA